MRKLAYGASALVLALAGTLYAATSPFKDPLDLPGSQVTRHVASSQMSTVARAGKRLVAVGARGLILVSDDEGAKWVQAAVPVSSDLLDVHFPTPKDGWAVGHDGVILHTRDAGNTWEKQYDGRLAKKQITEHFQALVDGGNEAAKRYLQDTQLNYENGPEQALLGVWFRDALHGYACGSFGTLLATEDGGVTWQPWIERVDVAELPPHYYAIRGTKKGVLMVAEKGMVFRLDEDKKHFVAIPTGYAGTFFNLIELGDSVLAMGLRGTVYRWKGEGEAKWEKIDTGVTSGIAAGAALSDSEAVLVTLSGQVLSTRDGGEHYQQIPVSHPMTFAGVAPGAAGSAVAVGIAGVRMISLR